MILSQRRILLILAVAVALATMAFILRGCGQRVDHHSRHTVDGLIRQCELVLPLLEDPNRLQARRPVAFDRLLAPIDMLVAKAKDALEEAEAAMRDNQPGRAETILDTAIRAAGAARGYARRGHDLAVAVASQNNPRHYRFRDQLAEACRHFATAAWARLRFFHPTHAPLFRDVDDYQLPARDPDLQRIQEALGEGLAAKPDDHETHYLDASIRLSTGDFGGALTAFRRCAELKPDFTESYGGMGKAYAMLGDPERAREAFESQVAYAERDMGRGLGAASLLSGLYNLGFLHDQRAQDAESGAQGALDREAAIRHYRRFLETPGADGDPAFAEVSERVAFLSAEGR